MDKKHKNQKKAKSEKSSRENDYAVIKVDEPSDTDTKRKRKKLTIKPTVRKILHQELFFK